MYSVHFLYSLRDHSVCYSKNNYIYNCYKRKLLSTLKMESFEAVVWEEDNSISEAEEDTLDFTSSDKKYTQKFRDSWLNDPRLANWIVEVNDDEVKCKYCDRLIKAKLSSLLYHGRTSKHMAAVPSNDINYPQFPEIYSKQRVFSSSSSRSGTEDDEENSEEEEDSTQPDTRKRKYSQKIRKAWFTDVRLAEWLTETEDHRLKCKYCNRLLRSKLSNLLRHRSTSKHLAAVPQKIKHNESLKVRHKPTNKNLAAVSQDINDDDSSKMYEEKPEPEEYCENDVDSGSDTKCDTKTRSSPRKRKRPQRFREPWFSDPRLSEWILQVNDKVAQCRYCDSGIKCKLSSLLRHASTTKHIEAVTHHKHKMQQSMTLNPDLSKPTCRVCLQNNNGEMSSIFDADAELNNLYIYEKIEQCAGIKVLRHEKMPTLICSDCLGFLKVSYKFRTICRNSNDYLKEILVVDQDEKKDVLIQETALSVSANSSKKDVSFSQVKAKLDKRPGASPGNVKIEKHSPSNSPKKCEESDVENSFNENYDEIWLDLACNDDDDQLSCGEHLEVSIDGYLEVNDKAEEINNSKKSVKRKRSPAKEKNSGIITSKTLDISPDGAAIIIEKKPRAKREREKQPHICDVCGNIYQRRYSLDLHMRRHRDEKPYECELCGYAFHSNFELIRHMRKHTGSRPYKCSFCARAFGDQSTLIKHERIHRNERPFKCETCGKCFTYSNVLKYHKYVHTGEKPYSCELCGKNFTRPHHLRAHLETLQHQSDPRSKILLQNIKKSKEDEALKVNTSILKI